MFWEVHSQYPTTKFYLRKWYNFCSYFFDNDSKWYKMNLEKLRKYNFITNFGHTRKYKSSLQNKYKNTSYIFLNLNMILLNYLPSKLYFNLEKVTDDTFLKIFDTNLLQNNLFKTKIKTVYLRIKINIW